MDIEDGGNNDHDTDAIDDKNTGVNNNSDNPILSTVELLPWTSLVELGYTSPDDSGNDDFGNGNHDDGSSDNYNANTPDNETTVVGVICIDTLPFFDGGIFYNIRK